MNIPSGVMIVVYNTEHEHNFTPRYTTNQELRERDKIQQGGIVTPYQKRQLLWRVESERYIRPTDSTDSITQTNMFLPASDEEIEEVRRYIKKFPFYEDEHSKIHKHLRKLADQLRKQYAAQAAIVEKIINQ